jgi:hypothetical protein
MSRFVVIVSIRLVIHKWGFEWTIRIQSLWLPEPIIRQVTSLCMYSRLFATAMFDPKHVAVVRRPYAKFVDSPYYSWVGTLWRYGDGLFFWSTSLSKRCTYNAPPTSRKRLSFLGASFSWLEKPGNVIGRDPNWILCSAWKKWIGGTPLEHPPYSPDLAPRAIFRLFQS